MPKKMISFILFVLALFVIMNAMAGVSLPAAGGKIKIIATVFPLAEFARTIVGERGEVSLILPPGADVHSWQPRVSDIRKLETAALLIYIGQGLEPWLDSLLKGADTGHLVRIEAAAGLNLIAGHEDEHALEAKPEHDHGEFDPHVWLDFSQDEMIVESLTQAVSRLDPEGSEIFRRNAEALKGKLRALDASYRTTLENCRGRRFLIGGHAAFSYLARRYGLEQVAVYGRSPEAVPTPRETAALIGRAKREGVKTVFFEPGVGDKMARLIAVEIGADIRILYPGHNLSPEQVAQGTSFFRLMEENLESLKHGLACR